MTLQELAPIGINLTTEQQERSGELAVAMAMKFDIAADAFSIVVTEKEDEPLLTVVYANHSGIHVPGRERVHHSWDAVRGERASHEDYFVRVGDETIDTRHGMTAEVYRAFIGQTSNRIGLLPDRAYPNSDLRAPSTWISGGDKDWSYSPLGSVRDDHATISYIAPTYNDSSYRFRPTAEIKN